MVAMSLVYRRPPTVAAAVIVCARASSAGERSVKAILAAAPPAVRENVCRSGDDVHPRGTPSATEPSTGSIEWLVTVATIDTASPEPRTRIRERGTSDRLTGGRISSG